jgi:hypothetical protein
MKTILTGFLPIIFIMFFSNVAFGCSCFELPLDLALEESSNVVILKLQSVEKYKAGEIGHGYSGIKQSKLVVQRVFKGNFNLGEELKFRQGGGGDCISTFSERAITEDYLFFLDPNSQKNGIWEGYTCSRSGNVKAVSADLLYLEKLEKVKGKTRLSGVLNQINDSPETGRWQYKRLSWKKVRIVGNRIDITIKTDENGVYEIYDLPNGKYKLTPQKLKGYKIDNGENGTVEIEIKAGSLEEQDFDYFIEE